MTRRLFGTDGIRGTAGTYPLDAGTIRRVGAALVKVMRRDGQKPGGRVLVGRDTRESGEWIERELAHGAASAGARTRAPTTSGSSAPQTSNTQTQQP